MKNANETTKLNTEVANVEETKKVSIFETMARAIAVMHMNNNKKAITKDFAAGCGTPENHFKSWTLWIDRLYDIVEPWGKKFNDKKVTDEELKKIYDQVFPIWRQLVRVGDSEEGGYKDLFVRESDVNYICVRSMKLGKSANGSIDVIVGRTEFRRRIEALLGIRMAQNAAMSADDYEIVLKYDKAVANLEKANNRLNGYERDGKEYEGLKDKLAKAEKTLGDMKIAVKAEEGATNEELVKANPILELYVKAVTDINSQIGQCEKSIKTADEYITKNKVKYATIMATIKPLEQ